MKDWEFIMKEAKKTKRHRISNGIHTPSVKYDFHWTFEQDEETDYNEDRYISFLKKMFLQSVALDLMINKRKRI